MLLSILILGKPLFALAKKVQWHQLVTMIGPLHTEMAFTNTLWNILKDSGWTTIVSNAQIARPVAESLVSGHDVVRTKYIHQVTASTLHQLQNQAYKDGGTDLMFGEWCSEMKDKSPTFHFWALVLKMELILLEFLRSIHWVNFQLYVTAMETMMLSFFALCHTHYIWWLSVHVFDIKMLPAINPDIYQAFQELCCFVVSRTVNSFSSMGLDQIHEQQNKDVKGGMMAF